MVGSFFHVMRNRLAESTSHRPVLLSLSLIGAGVWASGSFICLKVGIMTLRFFASSTAFFSPCSLIVRSIEYDMLYLLYSSPGYRG